MTLATDLNIRLRVVSEGIKRDDANWEHHAYKVTLFGPGGQMTFPYRCGLGIEGEPDVEMVLSGLLSDASIAENEEWEGMGLTPDQIRQTRKQTDELKRVLGEHYEKFLWGEGVESTWHIVHGDHGSGGFLAPPGDPAHRYSVEERSGTTGELVTSMGLESALTESWVPDAIKQQAKQIIADHPVRLSELWVGQVYGYFKNCYSPDGDNRKASDCLIIKDTNDPKAVPEWHLAYLHVKEYFPDHTPRLDLIANPTGLYGQRKCKKCKAALQYEAAVDAFAEPITAKLACPEGGQHEPADPNDDSDKVIAIFIPTKEKVEVLNQGEGTDKRWRVKSLASEHSGPRPRVFMAYGTDLKYPCGHRFQGNSPTCQREHKEK